MTPVEKIDVFLEANIDNSTVPSRIDSKSLSYIAFGHNHDMLSESKALSDYAAFVSVVEGYRTSGLSLDDAVAKAIRECKKRGIMTAYLESRGSEVLNMLLTEWNMEDALRVAREEERELGRLETSRANAARMKSDGLDIKLIVKYTGLKPDEIKKL
jgi:hypothetical protein